MNSGKPSALKKLSDDALRKRLQDLEDDLKEASGAFTQETKRLFDAIEKDLTELSHIDIPARLEPIFREGQEHLDKMHEEFLQVIERETEMLEDGTGDSGTDE